MVDPDGTITRTYDSAGRLSTVTFGPYSTTYGYDAADRLATVQTADGEVVTYGYDGSLRVSETWTGPVSGSVAQTFDNYFRLSTRTVMGTSPVTYGYDEGGLLKSGGALSAQRDPGGQMNGLLAGTTVGGVTDAWTYDSAGQPTSYTVQYGGATLYSVTYTRDLDERVLTKTEGGSGVAAHVNTYTYTEPRSRVGELG